MLKNMFSQTDLLDLFSFDLVIIIFREGFQLLACVLLYYNFELHNSL